MFGLGMPELLLILAIALIVIGPKKLPELAKTLGRAMGEFKRSAQDFKRSIDVETTFKDLKDIDVPNTDLKDILKSANTKDQPSAADKTHIDSPLDSACDSPSPLPGEKSSDTMTDDITGDKESTGTDNLSDQNKKN